MKTIISGNIVAGALNVRKSANHSGKVAVSGNLDDS